MAQRPWLRTMVINDALDDSKKVTKLRRISWNRTVILFMVFLLVTFSFHVSVKVITVTPRSQLPFEDIKSRDESTSQRQDQQRRQQLSSRMDQIRRLQRQQPFAGDSMYHRNNDTKNDDILPYGHVIRQLAQRILSRHVTESNVVVLAPTGRGISTVATQLYEQAKLQGHRSYLIDTSSSKKIQYLDEWWRDMSSHSRPKRLLLTVLDRPHGVFSSPQAADIFLGTDIGPIMTYVVLGVTATTGGKASPPFNYTFKGMDTVRYFLDHHYKVQLLSATDFWHSHDLESIEAEQPGDLFLPNDLITHDNLLSFLQWGAKAAATTKSVVSNHRDGFNRHRPAKFKAYLFATQGLDLAIPSRREYMSGNKTMNTRDWNYPYTEPTLIEERQFMVQNAPFASCPIEHDRLQIAFRGSSNDPWDAIVVHCDGIDVTQQVRKVTSDGEVTLWTNTGGEGIHAESVCIQLSCDNFILESNHLTTMELSINTAETDGDPPFLPSPPPYQVSCSTRIIPESIKNKEESKPLGTPNVLVLSINPISRPQFEFIMPQTHDILTKVLNFTDFSYYATVGNNKDPNQMALFAGMSFQDRDLANGQWIWDHLKKLGYATFKAEDRCIARSNMVQSTNPDMTHGDALHKLFCFHFARPNCVGGQLAADILLKHTKQFMNVYSNLDNSPWAAFVSLVDTHEDTMTLGAVIDRSVAQFLIWAESNGHLRDTSIMVLSDHGLHYGPYFLSKEGQRERSQPILYTHLPEQVASQERARLEANAQKWVTPFDVHATLSTLLNIPKMDTMKGFSLFKNLPKNRERCHNVGLIPRIHCDLLEPRNDLVDDVGQLEAPTPPSLLSFFADIPRDHRWKKVPCQPRDETIDEMFYGMQRAAATTKIPHTTTKQCKCATNVRDWFPCTQHPWGTSNSTKFPGEYFLMVACPSRRLQFEIRLIRENELVEKRKQHDEDAVEHHLPNILLLEIDSVSVEYANRHFTRTRELLRKYRTCHDGLCSVDFAQSAVVGPNSICNQVATLSGCFATLHHGSCFKTSGRLGDLCLDPTLHEYGMYLKSIHDKYHVFCPSNNTEPFLYDVARNEGYITLFGEEFCYHGSPWVLQDNVFPLNADIQIHKAFCRMSKHLHPDCDDEALFKYTSRCIGQEASKIGLEMIQQMWDAYDGMPKFAYLNAMAAHAYTPNTPALALFAEEYDQALATFLEGMLKRVDARKTIIFVRSDHGLQGGKSATIDYSTQIEQRHPFAEIIIPDAYPIETLSANSDKLVTPFDLHTMIHGLITQRRADTQQNQPEWTKNLLLETVPSARTCEQSKILPEFCSLKKFAFPSFGVCNMYELNQAVHCQDPTNGGIVGHLKGYNNFNKNDKLAPPYVPNTSTTVSTEVDPDELQTTPLVDNESSDPERETDGAINKPITRKPMTPCGETNSTPYILAAQELESLWSELHNITANYRGSSKVSGGIFLYPRQSFVLIRVLQQLASQLESDKETQQSATTIRVCETGFGGGHGAALFLAASDRVELITFDKFDRPYQEPALRFLQDKFGAHRVRHIAGDTCETVPAFFADPQEPFCDLVHGSSFCPSDMKDLISVTRPESVVTATAMHSLEDKDVYFGPEAQWRQMRTDSCLTNIICWAEEKTVLEKSFVFAKKGTKMEHHFCIGLNTAQCSGERPFSSKYMHTVDFGKICISGQVPVPP